MWLLLHKKGRSSHNCCLYQFFKIYFENKILKNENFDHPEKNELLCLQTNLFVKNSFYMTLIYVILRKGISCDFCWPTPKKLITIKEERR
jgi:hypothetical protein